MNARRTAVRLTFAGVDISTDINKHLLSLTYTDNEEDKTDDLQLILFNLVTQAEKQFGSGTGSLKYAAVADWIYQRIPAVLKLLFTSNDIEKMIEDVLEEAKKAWGANENLKGYIETPSVESLLVGIEAQAVQTEPAEK